MPTERGNTVCGQANEKDSLRLSTTRNGILSSRRIWDADWFEILQSNISTCHPERSRTFCEARNEPIKKRERKRAGSPMEFRYLFYV